MEKLRFEALVKSWLDKNADNDLFEVYTMLNRTLLVLECSSSLVIYK